MTGPAPSDPRRPSGGPHRPFGGPRRPGRLRRLLGGPRRLAGNPRRLFGNSLRTKLTLVNVVLLALGIAAATAVSLMGMKHYLLDNVDDELQASRSTLNSLRISLAKFKTLSGVREELGDLAPDAEVGDDLPPTEEVLVAVDDSGRPADVGYIGSSLRRRQLLAAIGDAERFARKAAPTDVTLGGDSYRAIGARLTDGSVVIATSTEDVHASVGQALRLDLALGFLLLVLLAVATTVSARQRLRPLEDMVETASAIAEGDLKRRVPSSRAAVMETEQLRIALNSMLKQVEAAFVTRERSEAQLRQFVADASHELRTPLSAIRGYLQLYDNGMLTTPEDRERAWCRVNAETDRMNHLVAELLTLARLDQQPELRFRSVDLSRLVRDAADDLRAQEPERPLTVRADGAILVQADEQGLRKVLANLLANVRAHTPPGTPVRLGLDRRDGVVCLTVADDGPGLDAKDAARVFDRFFRTGPGSGSGLGMAIVQGVVAAHGGEVAVRTAPGAGLTVVVTLRQAAAPGEPAGAAAPAALLMPAARPAPPP
ncbi:two-component sensor histidine kinase [Streptomyces longispororuber]|uniref:histidine kinase n=1 Tax=Streptomyces longispororuber TaxID=68230 RepID=A0A919DHJ0_9ACTN|nr:HAMP domain-containing sensor histidine kinase [Streptomyces longispororuber]GHE45031.1 two-component sensor histidine kinase [Streptomyces longispororuber]